MYYLFTERGYLNVSPASTEQFVPSAHLSVFPCFRARPRAMTRPLSGRPMGWSRTCWPTPPCRHTSSAVYAPSPTFSSPPTVTCPCTRHAWAPWCRWRSRRHMARTRRKIHTQGNGPPHCQRYVAWPGVLLSQQIRHTNLVYSVHPQHTTILGKENINALYKCRK